MGEVDGTYSGRKRCRGRGRRLGRCRGCGRKHEMSSQRAALGLGLSAEHSHALLQPPPHSDLGIQHINHQLNTHGILWSPQVAHSCKFEISRFGDRLAALPTWLSSYSIFTIIFFQVMRPLWPFFAASGITYFLVSKAQDMGVRCALFDTFSHLPAHIFCFRFFRIKPKASAMTRATRTRHSLQRRNTIRMIHTCNRGGAFISCNRILIRNCSSLTLPLHKLRVFLSSTNS
jgi:hypothetical protein